MKFTIRCSSFPLNLRRFSFQQIVGPHSSTALEATKTPGTIYHVSYMAEDDDKLKWPCWFTIDAESMLLTNKLKLRSKSSEHITG